MLDTILSIAELITCIVISICTIVLITICKKALSAKQNTSEQTGVEYIDFTEPTYTTEQVEQLIKGYNTVQRPQDFIERQIDDNYDDDSIEIITDIEEKVMETKRRGF